MAIRIASLERRRGRSWYRLMAASQEAWVVDQEALESLGLTAWASQGAGKAAPEPPEIEPLLLEEAERATARRRAIRLLGQRARSEVEMRRLLGAWPFRPDTIEDTVRWVRALGYLDDTALAHDVVDLRVGRGAVGRKALLLEMERRGIDESVALRVVAEKYPREREQEAALRLAMRQLAHLQRLAPAQRAARLWGYLVRRGFDEELAREVAVRAAHESGTAGDAT
ncbi:MAG: regulatory protein RecX [Limnochordaceae bacterium]|nr:regulatory protein RecX [Limnochordaceae bacterium]